ncbi:hypothetical protein E4U21_004206 [Claviceps maximensis]|nr:hypothetical protein E4U21_004206 [Claviceps maximensis]
MLFSIYLALLFVPGRHVYGYVVASSIRTQGHEPATNKDSVSSLTLERLGSRKTREHIRVIGAEATSLTAGDTPRLRTTSRETHHEHHEQAAVPDISLRRNEITAGPRYPHAEQVGLPRVSINAAGRLLNMPQDHTQKSKRQAESYLPTSRPSVILLEDKDKLWNSIALVAGIIATLASCIVLGILFLQLYRRKQDCSDDKACQEVPATEQSPVPCTRFGDSMQSHELFVPGTPNPAWQLPMYHAYRHKEQQQRVDTSPTWVPHNVVSPIDSLDGSTTLGNWYVAEHLGNTPSMSSRAGET